MSVAEELRLPSDALSEKLMPEQILSLGRAIRKALQRARPGQSFKVVGVTSAARSQVHKIAGAMKWSHRSEGPDANRILFLHPPSTEPVAVPCPPARVQSAPAHARVPLTTVEGLVPTAKRRRAEESVPQVFAEVLHSCKTARHCYQKEVADLKR